MARKSQNRIVMILQIFWEGIVWYCKYLDTLLKYMFFPVFGQIIGLLLIFTANYFYIVNIPSLIKKYPVLDNIPLVFTLLIIIVAPGFLIFSKALFDYLIAYGSLNSMAYVSRGAKMKNKPLETKSYDDLLKKRLFKFISLWLIFSLLFLVGIFPLLIVPYLILCVYFCLIFQIFMFEESISPIGAFKRSFYLIKTNFAITFFLICLSIALTYFLIPQLFIFAFEKINIIQYFVYPVQKYLDILPIQDVLKYIMDMIGLLISPQNSQLFSEISRIFQEINLSYFTNTVDLANNFVKSIIVVSITAFMLPLRCCWFTLLYKTFDTEKTEELRKNDLKKGK
ncbi:hypothetical protein IJG14_04335 [bacterium]|nr:hypothetical protein [bacterium]